MHLLRANERLSDIDHLAPVRYCLWCGGEAGQTRCKDFFSDDRMLLLRLVIIGLDKLLLEALGHLDFPELFGFARAAICFFVRHESQKADCLVP